MSAHASKDTSVTGTTYVTFDVMLFLYLENEQSIARVYEMLESVTLNVMVIYAAQQYKWWFAKRFLPPALVSSYDYVLIWDEDVSWERFDALQFINILKDNDIDYAQPAVIDASPWEPYMKLHQFPLEPGCWLSTPYALSQLLPVCRESFEQGKHVWHRVAQDEAPTKEDCNGFAREKRDAECGQGTTQSHWVPAEGVVGRWVNFVEIQVPVYSAAMWVCAWRYVQPDIGFMGWWYDVNLPQVCGVSHIAVIDKYPVLHDKRKGESADPGKGAQAGAEAIAGRLARRIKRFNKLPHAREVTNAFYPVDSSDGHILDGDRKQGIDRQVYIWGLIWQSPQHGRILPPQVALDTPQIRASQSFFGWEHRNCLHPPVPNHLEFSVRDELGKYTMRAPDLRSRQLLLIPAEQWCPPEEEVCDWLGLMKDLKALEQPPTILILCQSRNHSAAATAAAVKAQVLRLLVVVLAQPEELKALLGREVVSKVYTHVIMSGIKDAGLNRLFGSELLQQRLNNCGFRQHEDASSATLISKLDHLLHSKKGHCKSLGCFIHIIPHTIWTCI